MCLDRESNLQHFGVRKNAPTNWATLPFLLKTIKLCRRASSVTAHTDLPCSFNLLQVISEYGCTRVYPTFFYWWAFVFSFRLLQLYMLLCACVEQFSGRYKTVALLGVREVMPKNQWILLNGTAYGLYPFTSPPPCKHWVLPTFSMFTSWICKMISHLTVLLPDYSETKHILFREFLINVLSPPCHWLTGLINLGEVFIFSLLTSVM